MRRLVGHFELTAVCEERGARNSPLRGASAGREIDISMLISHETSVPRVALEVDDLVAARWRARTALFKN